MQALPRFTTRNVTEGGSITLVCPAKSDSSIQWKREDDTTFERTGRELHIHEAEVSDAGNYTCHVDSESYTINLKVLGDSSALPRFSTRNVTEGGNITLVCPAKSDSPIKWKREDNILKSTGRELGIHEAEVSDAGNYTCHVDSESYTINLQVLVTVKVDIELKVLNWTYKEELKNKSSQYYKNFTENFKKQIDYLYKDLPGYIGIEILNITQGSVKVKFRVKVEVTVKKPVDSSKEVKVEVGKKIVVKAKTGVVGNLRVSASPTDLQIDAPLPPPGLPKISEVNSDGVSLAWEHPEDAAFYGGVETYVIVFWEFGSKNSLEDVDVAGKDTSRRLTGLEADMRYRLKMAGKNAKNGKGLFTKPVDFTTKAEGRPAWLIAVVAVLVVLFCGSIICVIVFCWRRRRRNSREEENHEKSQLACTNEIMMAEIAGDKKDAHLLSYTTSTQPRHGKWVEVPRGNIKLLDELGAGAFGVVYKAQVEKEEGHTIMCAVKTLKADAIEEEKRDLMNELEIMTTVGYHPNLVNLIGACVDGGPLYVILDFAAHGQLLEYLKRRMAEFITDQNAPTWMANNQKYRIARDVASGMEHLAKHKCLHRDLSARNVLLGDNYIAKIADFGLSRDIYERGVYEKKTGSKLPVRWMAPEAIETLVFTAQTDVWSFGVLLWEIEAGGKMPYAGSSVRELLDYLKSGNRLEQPAGCSDEMYKIMKECWSAVPHHRPNFGELSARFEELSSKAVQELP